MIKCPICGKEFDRYNMDFTLDCHGIRYRLVCLNCWDEVMSKGYDGAHYEEYEERITEDY